MKRLQIVSVVFVCLLVGFNLSGCKKSGEAAIVLPLEQAVPEAPAAAPFNAEGASQATDISTPEKKSTQKVPGKTSDSEIERLVDKAVKERGPFHEWKSQNASKFTCLKDGKLTFSDWPCEPH